MIEPLLSRVQFKDSVFLRDGGLCVNCKNVAVDAHHLLERRLWKDGGYYLSNGVSLCGDCHLLAEKTLLSVNELREKANITNIIVPDGFDESEYYDKWGNIINENGTIFKGALFYDSSVQKILRETGLINRVVNYIKYPRTFHLPWSESLSSDDRMFKNVDNFVNQHVVVSLKMDGENTSIYSDGYVHARSIDGTNHPSRNWVKNFASNFAHDIPIGWRVCGENLFAKHSIEYNNLESYFLGFSIWDEYNRALSWNDTLMYFSLLNIKPVPVFYAGVYDEEAIKYLWSKNVSENNEGYVIRLSRSIKYSEFSRCVAKFVRKDHVQTSSKHWMYDKIVENKLKKESEQ